MSDTPAGECPNTRHGLRCKRGIGHEGPHNDGIGGWWNDADPLEDLYRFESGAHRVEKVAVPANWFSVDYETVRAIAETCAEGDKAYGVDNWRKGVPVSNLLNHAMEHLFKMLDGDNSEAHLEHAIWNLGKIRWMAKHRPELVDVPMIRRAMTLPESEEAKWKP